MGRNNSIIGVYLLEKGKETTIFNPEKINLEEKNYNIEIISQSIHENNNTSKERILQEINSKFIPELTGKFEIVISFNILLTSMFELFKNCNNLLEIDLSNLEGSNIRELNSTFENCENLENANLTLKNGTNIQSMDNSFNGCKNLKDIDLSNFGRLLISSIFSITLFFSSFCTSVLGFLSLNNTYTTIIVVETINIINNTVKILNKHNFLLFFLNLSTIAFSFKSELLLTFCFFISSLLSLLSIAFI